MIAEVVIFGRKIIVDKNERLKEIRRNNTREKEVI